MSTTDDCWHDAAPELEIAVAREGSRLVVTLAGELDIATGPALDEALTAALRDAPPATRLVLDLAALTFTDVAGLGVVLHHERELARSGGGVEVRSPSPMLRRIVDTLGLQDRLHLGA